MMNAVAYYRTRPSEPEASDLALRLQREAVQKEVAESGLELVAEFTEREGEEGSETYPAYAAAVRAASAGDGSDDVRDDGLVTLDTVLIIATQAAIGTGEPFREPEIRAEGMGRGGFIRDYLQVPTIPASPEIALPPGAPGPLCLYAAFRPCQLDTLVYLCNAGLEALTGAAVATDTISMNLYFTSRCGEERWAEEGRTGEQRWEVVPPGACVLVARLDHVINDMVSRHRLAYTDAAGRRWTAEAHDLGLSSCQPPQDPDQMWVAFDPVRPAADQADAGEQPGKTP